MDEPRHPQARRKALSRHLQASIPAGCRDRRICSSPSQCGMVLSPLTSMVVQETSSCVYVERHTVSCALNCCCTVYFCCDICNSKSYRFKLVHPIFLAPKLSEFLVAFCFLIHGTQFIRTPLYQLHGNATETSADHRGSVQASL